MSHCLIFQTKDKPRRAFGIVKERIVTTQPCSVIEEVQQGGGCGGGLSLCGTTSPKVCGEDVSDYQNHVVFSCLTRVILRGPAGFPEGQRQLNEGQ